MPVPEPRSSPDQILSAWQVHPVRNPQFRHEVGRRIAARRREASWPVFLRTHALAASSLLVLALVLGAWGGHAQARLQAQAQRNAMIQAYVRSLDARAMTERP
ncbi:MAG: hypothetical protein ACHQ4G_13145 [Opitutales bacterium]